MISNKTLLSAPLFGAVFALAFAFSPEAPAALGPGAGDEIELVEGADTCDEAVSLVFDPTSSKVYLQGVAGWYELTDQYLTVGYDAQVSMPITFGLVGRGGGWEVHIDTHYDDSSVSEVFATSATGEVVYNLPAPDPADLPTLDVYMVPSGAAIPTVPDVVIQPVDSCPGTAGGTGEKPG